jgi:putative tricarboxylic transport membrane protein
MLRRTGYAVVMFLAVALATNVFAQGASAKVDYPRKPITALMGFAPGGGSDVMLSMVRPHLEKLMKTTFVPVYKPGSGSDIALTELAMSKPDGYTVVVSCTPNVPINAYVRETSYKISDFAFTANVVTDPGIFVVRAESPYKTIADVIKAAKEKPGTFSVGVSSAPGDDWFASHMFEAQTQIKLNIVPFPGDGPSWQAALAGHIDATSNNLSIVYAQLRAGKLRALAIMTNQRAGVQFHQRLFAGIFHAQEDAQGYHRHLCGRRQTGDEHGRVQDERHKDGLPDRLQGTGRVHRLYQDAGHDL